MSSNRTPRSIVYGKWNIAGVAVEDADVEHLRVEQLAEPVADEVAHRLDVDLRREALLDRRDDRELGGSLVGLAQQAARLVEQAGVLERDRQARCDRPQDADVGLGERVLPVEVLERDDARRLAPDEERDPQGGERYLALQRPAAWPIAWATSSWRSLTSSGSRVSMTCLRNPTGDDGLVGKADAALDREREVDQPVRLVEDPDVQHLGVEDLAQLARPRGRTSPGCRAAPQGPAGPR